MSKHCDVNKESVFDYTPVTFYVEVPDLEKTNQYQQAMAPFFQFHQALEEGNERIKQTYDHIQEMIAKKKEKLEK